MTAAEAIPPFSVAGSQAAEYHLLTVPVAAAVPDKELTLTDPETEQQHRIQIFTSLDPQYGTAVKTIAQELHTRVYLDRGYITPAEVNPLGIYTDECSDRSTYLFVRNGEKDSAARYIHADKKKGGILSLPTAQHFDVDPEALRETAGVNRLVDLKPNEVIEISGLASEKKDGSPVQDEVNLDATKALYTRMLRDSVEQGHKVWLLNVDKSYLRVLNVLAGRDQVRVLGPAKEYQGPPTVPVAINPQAVIRAALQDEGPFGDMKRELLKEVLPGVSDRYLAPDIKKSMDEHEIPTTHYSEAKRLATNPKTALYAGVVAFSAARDVSAGTLDGFHGDTAALMAIDIPTAFSYTWGATEAFTGKSLPRRAAGAVIGAASFVAPYAYFGANGEHYPGYVKAAVGAFAAAAAIKEVVGRRVRNNREQDLVAGLRQSDLVDAPPRVKSVQ